MFIANFIKTSAHKFGLEVTRYFPGDLNPDSLHIIKTVMPFTMTSPARVDALIQAVRYIVQNNIPGDVVECGVWKGGSMLAVVLTLQSLGITNRNLHLFDTFTGMTPPGKNDVSVWGESADNLLSHQRKSDGKNNLWCYAPLEAVQKTLANTDYPTENMFFIQGKVEETLPAHSPGNIALLRLDTDWYESTRHELIHLYPRLVNGGILILDDYGSWLGARKAVDEYFEEYPPKPLLCRIDDTGRIAIKT